MSCFQDAWRTPFAHSTVSHRIASRRRALKLRSFFVYTHSHGGDDKSVRHGWCGLLVASAMWQSSPSCASACALGTDTVYKSARCMELPGINCVQQTVYQVGRASRCDALRISLALDGHDNREGTSGADSFCSSHIILGVYLIIFGLGKFAYMTARRHSLTLNSGTALLGS